MERGILTARVSSEIEATVAATAKPCLPAGRRLRPVHEDGYVLIAVLFLVALVLITLAVAAPKMAADIERDREVELIHRGQQYVRAIKLYYKKFGAYPPNMDALEKTGEIRFLRKRYTDPITGKDDWKLIHFGENKTPSLGFFGQPMGGVGGSTLAGIGPGGVGQNIGAAGGSFGKGGSSFGGSSFGGSGSSFGGNSAGSSSFGGSSFGGSSASGSSFGSSSFGGSTGSGSSFGGGSSGAASNGTDANFGNSAGIASGTGAGTGTGTGSGSGSGGTDNNTGTTSGSATNGSGSSTNSAFGGNGQTFGGGGIIGVESSSPKVAILEWKKKKNFNEWEFWFDPNSDRMTVSNSTGAIGQPAGGTGNGSGFGNSGSGFGNSGQSGFGSSGGFGGSSGFGSSGGFGSSSTGQGSQQNTSPTPTPSPSPSPQ